MKLEMTETISNNGIQTTYMGTFSLHLNTHTLSPQPSLLLAPLLSLIGSTHAIVCQLSSMSRRATPGCFYYYGWSEMGFILQVIFKVTMVLLSIFLTKLYRARSFVRWLQKQVFVREEARKLCL